jgi:hypothetical protein
MFYAIVRQLMRGLFPARAPPETSVLDLLKEVEKLDASIDLSNWQWVWRRSLANRVKFKRGLVVYASVIFGLICLCLHLGLPVLVGPTVLLASFVPVLFWRWFWENKRRWRVNGKTLLTSLDPRTQSWAFLADVYGLGPMAVFATLAWPHLPHNRLFTGDLWPVWSVISLAAGVGLAWLFARGEGKIYDVLRRNSHTKLIHNGVAFSVLGGTIFHVMIPIWTTGFNRAEPWSWLATLGFVLWLLSALADGQRTADGWFWRWPLLARTRTGTSAMYSRPGESWR